MPNYNESFQKFVDGRERMPDYSVCLQMCLQRWDTQDEKTRYFVNNYSTWIDQLPNEVVPIIMSLLRDFNYYSHEKVNAFLAELHSRLLKCDCTEEGNTIYTYLPSKEGRLGSSMEYMIDYKRMNRLSKYCFVDNFKELPSQRWNDIHNIVIIDDCCGTGTKFSDYIKANVDDLRSKNIYYIVIEMMSDAINCIESLKKEYDISINILAGRVSEKAFSSSKWGGSLENARNAIHETTVSMGIPPRYTMGFKDAESLMAFYNDTPNDTLGLFWHNTTTLLFAIPERICSRLYQTSYTQANFFRKVYKKISELWCNKEKGLKWMTI